MMIVQGALKSIEKCLNLYISKDPEKAKKLSYLSNKTIQVTLTPIQLTFFIYILNETIQLTLTTDQSVDTTISGSPIALISALTQKTMSLSESVSITGDLKLIQNLKHTLNSIDIDWEELFSNYIGDTASTVLFKKMNKLKQFKQRFLNSFTRCSREYIQEESRLLPTRYELETFFKEVDVIRNDIDRLQAKVSFLMQSERDDA